jgi:hypothetical protein
MDGVFQHALIAYLSGDKSAPDALEATVRQLLMCFLGDTHQSPRPPDIGERRPAMPLT